MSVDLSLEDFFQRASITRFSGVPCSYLNPLFSYADERKQFVLAANEGDAVAYAAGCWLAGVRCSVLMQNSGLGNAVSPISSLTDTFQIPVIGFISLRGDPRGKDAPQHSLMGQATTEILRALHQDWLNLDELSSIAIHNETIENSYLNRTSLYFVVAKNTFSKVTNKCEQTTGFSYKQSKLSPPQPEILPKQKVLEKVVELFTEDTAIISSTGYTARELFELSDRPSNFYMVGSMGCAPSLALGVADSAPKTPTVILDGDGALVMRLGNLAMIGAKKPANIFHILLNNGIHESTGGQYSYGSELDFSAMASIAGYERTVNITSLDDLDDVIKSWKTDPTCTFVHVHIKADNNRNLGRPNVAPEDIALRFREFLTS